MHRKYIILITVLAVIAFAGTLAVITDQTGQNRTEKSSPSNAPAVSEQDAVKTAVHLYFADKDNGYLIAEKRVLRHSGEPLAFGRVLIEALIEGPQKGLMRTLPETTEIRALFKLDDETLCVDFSEAIREKHPGGSQTELLTIYSIVNTVVLNLPEFDQVKVLVGGHEATTLAGHVDLQFPFSANMLLIR